MREREVLSEEDWALLEIMHSPTDFVPFIVPKNFRNPRNWYEDEPFHIRTYQKSC